MNKTISIGNLTEEPKITETSTGKKMARFTLALNRMKDGADYPSFVAWEKKAEFLEKWCHKGMKLAVEGHILNSPCQGFPSGRIAPSGRWYTFRDSNPGHPD